MNKLICGLLSLTLTSQSSAGVAYRGPRTDTVEFQAWIATMPDLKGASESSGPIAAVRRELNYELERAQNLFIAGSVADSRAAFMRLTQASRSADWSLSQRRAIHYAYLRVAQLADDESSRDESIRAAITFAPDLNVDPEVFPPPLVSAFNIQKKFLAKAAHRLNPREQFHGYETLAINGRRFAVATTSEIVLFPGIHRINLTSSAYEHVTIELSAREILRFVPPRKELVGGSCEKPDLTSIEKSAHVFFDKDCIYTFTDGEWKRIRNVHVPDLKSFNVEPKPLEISQIQAPSKPLMRSPWFWAGVASVVAAAVILMPRNHSNAEPEVIPTQRTGY